MKVTLGVVIQGEISRCNFLGEKSGGQLPWRDFMGAVVQGEVIQGEYPDTINHNAVFFNSCMSYLPPFPI